MSVKKRNTNPLVGKWFHSYNEDKMIEWQGQVLAEIAPGQFLVALYEWFVGVDTTQRLVPLTAMASWIFYDSNDEMNAEYEHYSKYHYPRLEKAAEARRTQAS